MFAQFWQLSTAAGILTKSVILSEYTLPNIYIYNILSLYNRHLNRIFSSVVRYFIKLFDQWIKKLIIFLISQLKRISRDYRYNQNRYIIQGSNRTQKNTTILSFVVKMNRKFGQKSLANVSSIDSEIEITFFFLEHECETR